MKRVLRTKSLVAVGIGASAAIWLSSKPNRILAKSLLRDLKRKIKPSPFIKNDNLPIEKGGNPHPADIEDNKMVDEGAMYAVKFYNEKKQ